MILVDKERLSGISAAIGFSFWLSVVYFLAFPDPQGTDFYPLWVGAQAIVNGSNPYAPPTTELLRKSWSVTKFLHVSDVVA